MRKTKQKFTLTQIALSVVAVGAVGSTANAQWAVTNVNDPLYFGPTGIFTQLVGQMINSSKAATDRNSAIADLDRQQTTQLHEDADARNRKAMGESMVLSKLSELRPQLSLCVSISKGLGKASASAATAGGASGGGVQHARQPGNARTPDLTKPVQNPNDLLDGPTTDKETQAIIVETRSRLGTCSAEEVAKKMPGCISPAVRDVYAGTNMLPASDISPLSLFGNTNNTLKANKQSEFASRSIPQKKSTDRNTVEDLDLSRAYINNLLMTNLPARVDPELGRQDPQLFAQYRVLQMRIESSQKALRDILNLTVAPEATLNPSSQAGKYWNANSSAYKNLFGMNLPPNPSMRDYISFQVSNDYMGMSDNTPVSGDEILRVMNERMALANYISYRQLEAIENVNVQLAAMHMGQIAPFDMNAYKAGMDGLKKAK